MTKQTQGNCHICGATLGKTAMKNHILKQHGTMETDQKCRLLKIEGAYDKAYWLYVDIPIKSTLSDLDDFLRYIWLECCGHMSAFTRASYQEVSNRQRIGSFSIGEQLTHEYDFGTTTETLITFIGEINRKSQKEAVRLLARNIPPVFTCAECEQPAEYVDCEYSENPFYCKACSDEHDSDFGILPITNSPRMGICGYDGGLDSYEFDPNRKY